MHLTFESAKNEVNPKSWTTLKIHFILSLWFFQKEQLHQNIYVKRKTARIPHFHNGAYSSLLAEPTLSNSNFKVYVGDRWAKIKFNL